MIIEDIDLDDYIMSLPEPIPKVFEQDEYYSEDTSFSINDQLNQIFELMNGKQEHIIYWKRKAQRLLEPRANPFMQPFPIVKASLANSDTTLNFLKSWKKALDKVLIGSSVYVDSSERVLNKLFCPLKNEGGSKLTKKFRDDTDCYCDTNKFPQSRVFGDGEKYKGDVVTQTGIAFSDGGPIMKTMQFDADEYIDYVQQLTTGDIVHAKIDGTDKKGTVQSATIDRITIRFGSEYVIYFLDRLETNKIILSGKISKQDFIAKHFKESNTNKVIVRGSESSYKICNVIGDDILANMNTNKQNSHLNYDDIIEDYPDINNHIFYQSSWSILNKTTPKRTKSSSKGVAVVKIVMKKHRPHKLYSDLEDYKLSTRAMLDTEVGKLKEIHKPQPHSPLQPLHGPHFYSVKEMLDHSKTITKINVKAKATLLLCINSYTMSKKTVLNEYPLDYKIYNLKQVETTRGVFWDIESEYSINRVTSSNPHEITMRYSHSRRPTNCFLRIEKKPFEKVVKPTRGDIDEDDAIADAYEMINEAGNFMNQIHVDVNAASRFNNVVGEHAGFVKKIELHFNGRIRFTDNQLSRVAKLQLKENANGVMIVMVFMISYMLFEYPTFHIEPDPVKMYNTIMGFNRSKPFSIELISSYFCKVLNEILTALELTTKDPVTDKQLNEFFSNGISKTPELLHALLLKKAELEDRDAEKDGDVKKTTRLRKYQTAWNASNTNRVSLRVKMQTIKKANKSTNFNAIKTFECMRQGPDFINDLVTQSKCNDDLLKQIVNTENTSVWHKLALHISSCEFKDLQILLDTIVKEKDVRGREVFDLLLHFIISHLKSTLGKIAFNFKFPELPSNKMLISISKIMTEWNNMEDGGEKAQNLIDQMLNVSSTAYASNLKNAKYAMMYLIVRAAKVIGDPHFVTITVAEPLQTLFKFKMMTTETATDWFEKSREGRKESIMNILSEMDASKRGSIQQLKKRGLLTMNDLLGMGQDLDMGQDNDARGTDVDIDGAWDHVDDDG